MAIAMKTTRERHTSCTLRSRIAMLSLARMGNALAPASVRLFSAAAASGENSFKVCCVRAIQKALLLLTFL
jgi:hypothetical protein